MNETDLNMLIERKQFILIKEWEIRLLKRRILTKIIIDFLILFVFKITPEIIVRPQIVLVQMDLLLDELFLRV
jgi:hypothetical protein